MYLAPLKKLTFDDSQGSFKALTDKPHSKSKIGLTVCVPFKLA